MDRIAKGFEEEAKGSVGGADIRYPLASDQFIQRQVRLVRQLLNIKQICKAIVWIPLKTGQYDVSLKILELASEAQAFSN
jgi:hypothetical protein